MFASSEFAAIIAFIQIAIIVIVIVRLNEISKSSKKQQSLLEFLCRHFSPEEYEKFNQNMKNQS